MKIGDIVNESELKKVLGKRIQNIRLSKKITQEELADSIEISTQFVSDMERGLKKPSVVTLINIMVALSITPNELFMDFISDENDTITEINKILCELSEFDRQYLLNLIRDYKKMIDKRS